MLLPGAGSQRGSIMKKFYFGDVVSGWSPVSETSPESTLYEVFASHASRDSISASTHFALAEELRSNLPEATAA